MDDYKWRDMDGDWGKLEDGEEPTPLAMLTCTEVTSTHASVYVDRPQAVLLVDWLTEFFRIGR